MESQKSSASNIRVFCRFRPFNKQELENKAEKIHRISSKKQLIIKDQNRQEEISFMFDHIFDTETTQEEVYQNIGLPVLNNILDGFNGTIMAYGQTSSGKTHTMQGHDVNDKDIKGLIPRIIENLFLAIEKSAENLEFKLKVSICELYMEKINDLLDISKTDLKIRENKNTGPYVENLTEAYISNKVEFYRLLHLGQKNRATCMTNMNALSSRSHMIFLLTLNQLNLESSQAKTSKLFLIDLAGSEKISKTGAEGKVLEQAKKINLSLTSLGMVIKSLSEGQSHVPYRDSKLTRVIKDSLGGNSKTTLLVACSPHEMHVSETISTLRFGENAQKIKNKPKINRELTVPELQRIIEQLEAKIEEKDEWIRIIEDYIKNELNAPLPKNDKKLILKPKVIEEEYEVETENDPIREPKEDAQFLKVSEMVSESTTLASSSIFLENLEINTFESDSTKSVKKPLTDRNYNDEYVASIESELESCKQEIQSELAKYYQIKKEFNSVSENLKNLMEENIGLQEREKDFEQRLCSEKEELINNFRSGCTLIFGEIMANSNLCNLEKCGCHTRVKEIIENKGRALSMVGNSTNFVDYWQTEKLLIEKKLQEASQQKTLETKTPEQKKEEENKKLLQMEESLDSLYGEYQQMLALQTNWKVECQLYERKLKIKEEKIAELKNMLEEIQEQMELMADDNDETMSVNTKIVKPLKGGFLYR